MLRGPDHYSVSDPPGTAPQALIHPNESCTRIDGGELDWQVGTGVRTWGTAVDTAFALSTAFRRQRGISPRQHRLASAPGATTEAATAQGVTPQDQ